MKTLLLTVLIMIVFTTLYVHKTIRWILRTGSGGSPTPRFHRLSLKQKQLLKVSTVQWQHLMKHQTPT